MSGSTYTAGAPLKTPVLSDTPQKYSGKKNENAPTKRKNINLPRKFPRTGVFENMACDRVLTLVAEARKTREKGHAPGRDLQHLSKKARHGQYDQPVRHRAPHKKEKRAEYYSTMEDFKDV